MKNNFNKKFHNYYSNNLTYNCHFLKYGNVGIKSSEFALLKDAQLQAIIRLVNKKIKILSKGKYTSKCWTLIQLTSNLTSLSPESRMGKGKGPIISKIAYIKPGQVIFEFSGLSFYSANLLYKYLKIKLPFSTKLVMS